MKISIITVVRNAEDFIENCILSVLTQDYDELEYIVIDGESEDQTMHLVNKYAGRIHQIVSEKDQGIYHAMNKGIALASGDILGILNADDFFPSQNILSQVVQRFIDTEADIVYGDIHYVDRNDTGKIIRKWKSGDYKRGSFQWGWMPPHPGFYVKRDLFEKYGLYKPEYGSAADYELMIRFLHKHQLKAAYLSEVIVKMRSGGISNRTLQNRLKASKADLAAMRANGLPLPGLTILLKPLRKIPQFL